MIAGLSGRSGKTVITLGLLRLLSRRGLVVQPFKKGPDFVDPGWHRVASGRVSRNLDSFLMTPEQILGVYAEATRDSDLSIIEGAMGLFDGMDLEGSTSSAQIAKITQTPVILVVETTRMTRTTAALVMGLMHFDPELRIAGVILNRVRSQRHEKLIRDSIESTCGLPVLGAIPVDSRLDIPDRHLGLLSSEEAAEREQIVDAIADVIAEHVDIGALLTLAGEHCSVNSESGVGAESITHTPLPMPCSELSAAELAASQLRQSSLPKALHKSSAPEISILSVSASASESKLRGSGLSPAPRIAVLRDAAFCFYYEENLEALRQQGAELVFIDSLVDTSLPEDIHALHIGGGFPEVFAAQLEANKELRSQLREIIEADLPVYAEGGGLMYLGRRLEFQGDSFEMVGALPLDTVMQQQRQSHGYLVVEATDASLWLEAGSILKGHAFHHFLVTNLDPSFSLTFKTTLGLGIIDKFDGLFYRNVLATSLHVNALASPLWAEKLVERARLYQ